VTESDETFDVTPEQEQELLAAIAGSSRGYLRRRQ